MKRSIVTGISVLVILSALIGVTVLQRTHYRAPAPDAPRVSVTISAGSSVGDISDQLAQEGLIDRPSLFRWYVRLAGKSADLQAGSFALRPGMSYQDVANTLSQAQAQEVKVTIPEGFTTDEMFETLHNAIPTVKRSDWERVVGSGSALRDEFHTLQFIPDAQGLEGYLFPDTYRFRPDATAEEVVRRMVDTFEQRLAERQALPDDQGVMPNGQSVHEAITLASIIEREVQQPEDMRMVADIFFKRLEDGMRLQADSTVNYVVDGDNPSLTLEQTKIDSPYNTYRYTGLPPGPISNPGMNAIDAVLNPVKNDFYYFLTTPEGEVKYAKTFQEHVQNKQQYLQ